MNSDIIYLIFEKDTYKIKFILNSLDECMEAFADIDISNLDWRAINLNALLEFVCKL